MEGKEIRSGMADRQVQSANVAEQLEGVDAALRSGAGRANGSAGIRCYLKRGICTVRREGDHWLVSGPYWPGEQTFSDEHFNENFSLIY